MALWSKLAQVWTWLTQPTNTFANLDTCYVLFSIFSCRLKYIPYSNRITIVFPGFDKEMELYFDNKRWNSYLSDNQARMVDPTAPPVDRVQRVLVKIIQALSDGLRLRRDCKVYANHNLPFNTELPKKNNAVVVPSRFGNNNKEIISRPMSFLGMKHNTEHLDGLDWEVMVVKSHEDNAYYHGNGKIVLHHRRLPSTDEELACTLAHEVGHGVAMHMEGDPHKALWGFALFPWPLGFWGPAIFIRLCDMVLHFVRMHEYEADHIGLMLMASAGYDPRLAPQFRMKDQYDFLLDTTHPSGEKRAKMLSRDTVMNRAVQIYEQVQAGHDVPSFIS